MKPQFLLSCGNEKIDAIQFQTNRHNKNIEAADMARHTNDVFLMHIRCNQFLLSLLPSLLFTSVYMKQFPRAIKIHKIDVWNQSPHNFDLWQVNKEVSVFAMSSLLLPIGFRAIQLQYRAHNLLNTTMQ